MRGLEHLKMNGNLPNSEDGFQAAKVSNSAGDPLLQITVRVRLGVHVFLFLSLLLTGCTHSPSISEVQLTAKDNKIHIGNLYCPANGSLVAIGNTQSLNSEGIAFYSDDRGQTWTKAPIKPAPTGVTLSLIQIPSESGTPKLYISGYISRNPLPAKPGPWWISLDGGHSWDASEPKLPFDKKKAFVFGPHSPPEIVVADRSGILITAVSESGGVSLLRSTDWGAHWDNQLLEMPKNFASQIVTDERGHLAFFGQSLPRHPFDVFGGSVYWSSDAGATWNKGNPSHSFLSNMGLFRSPSGKMVAFNNTERKFGSTFIIRSTDNGRTWERSFVGGEFGIIIGITGDGKGRIVALTNFRVVLLSDDEGATWRKGHLPELRFNRSIERFLTKAPMVFNDEGVVIAAIGNKILRSSDRGDTWTIVDSKIVDGDFRFSQLCADGNGLIIVTGEGMLVRSLDWGLTWQPGKMQ